MHDLIREHVGRHLRRIVSLQVIPSKIQLSTSYQTRIELTNGTGCCVAWIGKNRLSGFGAFGVELLEVCLVHNDFTANFSAAFYKGFCLVGFMKS